MDGRLWFSSPSSGALRWRLHPPPPSATLNGRDHHYSTTQKQPRKFRFPVSAAATAGVLALLGDTIAQVRSRAIQHRSTNAQQVEVFEKSLIGKYDWLRALRMTTYGFFIYGPGSQLWYEFLDRMLHEKTVRNLSMKVLLNQIVLGPCVIAVVFFWNSLWQGKLDKLPALYLERAAPTLIDGWKFWIPASILNFSVVPLQTRVGFMSFCSIFWNFYLSTTMGKASP